MARRTLEQRHSVTMKVGTPMTIPWVSKKGVTFVLESDGEKIGELRIDHRRPSPRPPLTETKLGDLFLLEVSRSARVGPVCRTGPLFLPRARSRSASRAYFV